METIFLTLHTGDGVSAAAAGGGERGPFDELTSRLTATERRFVRLIAADKSSKEIGAELSIHYRTIENHRTDVCRELQYKDRM